MSYGDTARKMIIAGEHDLVRKLHKVVAFDTRFNLYDAPEYKNEKIKAIYLLDCPQFDCHYEVVFADGTRKLISDKTATKILRQEKQYLEEVKDSATELLKKTIKFARLGDLGIDPIADEKQERAKKEREQQKLAESEQNPEEDVQE